MADWLRPTLRRRARMAQPVVAQWRDQRHASICLLHRASGAFLHRVCAGTIRSSKLDVQVTGSADRGVALLGMTTPFGPSVMTRTGPLDLRELDRSCDRARSQHDESLRSAGAGRRAPLDTMT
jgi:hypothetical protein